MMLLFFLPLSGQVADKTVTDCNGNSRSIHGVLATGKVLVVTSSGVDCSICMGAAPAVQTFAAQNTGTMEVWGAMTFKSSANTNKPSCTQVNNWVNTYSWNDVFALVDSDRHFFMSGTPRYIVYDPSDYSIAYSGPNRSQAFQTATALANTVGFSTPGLRDVELVNFPGGIELKNFSGTMHYKLVSLTGKLVASGNLDQSGNRLMTNTMRPGIYLLALEAGDGQRITRKIFVN